MNLDIQKINVEVAGDSRARRNEIRARIGELEDTVVRSPKEHGEREREIRRLLDLLR